MGFSIGSIVSDITSAVTDPGKLVTELANSILPSNMKAVGDALGGLVDFETGHQVQGLSHLTDALKDLPQLAQSQSAGQTTAAATPAGTAAAEPTPPPTRATPPAAGPASATPAPTVQSPKVSVQTFGRETITSIDNGARTTVIVQRPGQRAVVQVRADRAPPSGGSVAGPGAQGATPPAPTPTATTGTPAASTTAAASGSTGSAAASTTAVAAASTGTSAASTTAAVSGSTDVTSTGATTTSASTGGAASTADAAAPKNLASLMALSPDQFIQAVTSGKIPPDVANSPSAMAQIQARMNQITQMNQLVTSMMAALHQMQMSIIQNIRC